MLCEQSPFPACELYSLAGFAEERLVFWLCHATCTSAGEACGDLPSPLCERSPFLPCETYPLDMFFVRENAAWFLCWQECAPGGDCCTRTIPDPIPQESFLDGTVGEAICPLCGESAYYQLSGDGKRGSWWCAWSVHATMRGSQLEKLVSGERLPCFGGGSLQPMGWGSAQYWKLVLRPYAPLMREVFCVGA